MPGGHKHAGVMDSLGQQAHQAMEALCQAPGFALDVPKRVSRPEPTPLTRQQLSPPSAAAPGRPRPRKAPTSASNSLPPSGH
jgi:hypothetical protein